MSTSAAETEPDSSSVMTSTNSVDTFYFPGLERQEKELFLKALEKSGDSYNWKKKAERTLSLSRANSIMTIRPILRNTQTTAEKKEWLINEEEMLPRSSIHLILSRLRSRKNETVEMNERVWFQRLLL